MEICTIAKSLCQILCDHCLIPGKKDIFFNSIPKQNSVRVELNINMFYDSRFRFSYTIDIKEGAELYVTITKEQNNTTNAELYSTKFYFWLN